MLLYHISGVLREQSPTEFQDAMLDFPPHVTDHDNGADANVHGALVERNEHPARALSVIVH